MTTSAVTSRKLTLQTEKWCREPVPCTAPASALQLAPSPSGITPLAGTVNPLPCLVEAGLVIAVLIHGICFTWALLRTLPWHCAPPPVWIRGSETPLQRYLIEGCASATTEPPPSSWAPCLCAFQDTYHPPPLHLPCSWLIQAAQGAGNSSQINPSSPTLILA